MELHSNGGNTTHVYSAGDSVDDVIEKRIQEIVTVLAHQNGGKSNVYEIITSIVDRALIKVAMERSRHIKSAAADFLGINRNTLHNKIVKLGMDTQDFI